MKYLPRESISTEDAMAREGNFVVSDEVNPCIQLVHDEGVDDATVVCGWPGQINHF